MVVVNPQTVSDNLKYPGKLSGKEKTALKKNSLEKVTKSNLITWWKNAIFDTANIFFLLRRYYLRLGFAQTIQ